MNLAVLNEMRDTKACGQKVFHRVERKKGREEKWSSWPNRQLLKSTGQKCNRNEDFPSESSQIQTVKSKNCD